MLYCKHCEKECKNARSHKAHERLCPENKDRKYVSHTKGRTAWNKGKTKETCEITKRQSEIKKEAYRTGKRQLSGVAVLTTEERSANAKKQGFGGYNEKAGASKLFHVKDSYGNEVCLQSSYEMECANILNDLNIDWVRPKYVNYLIDGQERKYYPDFFLPNYNIFLDPKNDYLAVKDAKKIELVISQNKIRVEILTKEMLNRDTIIALVSPNGEGLS